MIVLDTHILVWWSDNPKKLSKIANQAIELAKKKHEICISSISLWEIAHLVNKGRIEFTLGFENWVKKIENLSFIRFIPVDNSIAVKSVNLPNFSNNDPADRIIVATALSLGVKLITGDQRILKYPFVKTIW